MVFPTHTFSLQIAAQMWRDYGGRIHPGDQVGDLYKRFPSLSKRKVRGLITIRNYLQSLGVPDANAVELAFGPYALRTSSEEDAPVEPGDIKIVHTADEVNCPIMNLDDLLVVSKANMRTHEVVAHRVNTWSTVT